MEENTVSIGALNEAAGLLGLDDRDLETLRGVIGLARKLEA